MPTPALGMHNWIFMRDSDDFDAAFQVLMTAIETDLAYVRTHTRLLIKAIEWDRAQRDPSFLLRGNDLTASEAWLKVGATQSPQPTDLQADYIVTSRQQPHYQPKGLTVVLTSALVTLALLGVRLIGGLETPELLALDQVMQLRPSEPPDHRLLVIEINDADIQAQNQRNETTRGSLSPQSLNRLLDKLEYNRAKVIGLDVIWDFPTNPQFLRSSGLGEQLQNEQLVAVCKTPPRDFEQTGDRGTGTAPEIPLPHVAFANVVDDPDRVIRRQLLVQQAIPDAPCVATQAFSLMLAQRYLADRSRLPLYRDPLITGGELQLANVGVPRLGIIAGGYQGRVDAGYQTLINYRATAKGVGQVAQRVSLADVLNNKVAAEDIHDRIVLIGVTSRLGSNDYHLTPYQEEIPGVVLQAQMVSQLISAVLDGRPFLGTWALWGDALWIWGWALAGGGVVLVWRSPLARAIVGGTALILVCLGSVAFLLIGSVWVPLVPAALALGLTGAGTVYATIQLYHHDYQRRHRRR
jgi:CHASE2 domain-containing sensor protein